MNKLLQMLGLAVALATVSGCELYFGGHGESGSGGTWNYCGSDGYYQCQGDNCTWVSPSCPAGGSGGSNSCTSSADCAAGCYCENGTCAEGGFCTQDSDCGPGYHCNTDRSSCEPNPPVTGCNFDSECPSGQFCDPSHHCTETCICTTDAQAVAHGYGWCDETRMTCLPGQDPAGTCAGDAATTCTTARPTCPSGEVPTLLDGCFTGQCRATAQCDLPAVCSHINDEPNCLGRADCSGLYTGIGCHKPDGSACHAGDTNCTCQSFVFASCANKTTARQVIEYQGVQYDISQLMLQ
jgi:hypothetical protein